MVECLYCMMMMASDSIAPDVAPAIARNTRAISAQSEFTGTPKPSGGLVGPASVPDHLGSETCACPAGGSPVGAQPENRHCKCNCTLRLQLKKLFEIMFFM